jgi:hypothetical protein
MNVRLYAPCFNPEGKTEVTLERKYRDSWGDIVWEVRAVHGQPWWDAGYFGYSPTATRKFWASNLIVEVRSE